MLKRILKMKIKIKRVLIICSVAVLFMFTAPLFGRIFNIGNVVGIFAGAVLLLSGIYLDRIVLFFKKARSKKAGRIIFDCALGVSFSVVISFAVALGSVIAFSTTNASNQQTVIVLGCAVYGDYASPMLGARTDAAYRYLVENDEAVAVLSGGQGNGENISEAQCMFNLLTEKGIDKDRLYLEDKSTNTAENIKNSKEIIEENGLSSNVVIASSDFHLKRATMIAQKNGLSAHRISAKSGFFSVPAFYVRDTLGVIKEFILR